MTAGRPVTVGVFSWSRGLIVYLGHAVEAGGNSALRFTESIFSTRMDELVSPPGEGVSGAGDAFDHGVVWPSWLVDGVAVSLGGAP